MNTANRIRVQLGHSHEEIQHFPDISPVQFEITDADINKIADEVVWKLGLVAARVFRVLFALWCLYISCRILRICLRRCYHVTFVESSVVVAREAVDEEGGYDREKLEDKDYPTSIPVRSL